MRPSAFLPALAFVPLLAGCSVGAGFPTTEVDGGPPAVALDAQYYDGAPVPDAFPVRDGVTDYYGGVMARMHNTMMVPLSGDADTDFMRQMIPHHQGAVDMALVVLKEGHDPYVRQLAWDIVFAQRREINYMNYWLNMRGADAPVGITAPVAAKPCCPAPHAVHRSHPMMPAVDPATGKALPQPAPHDAHMNMDGM